MELFVAYITNIKKIPHLLSGIHTDNLQSTIRKLIGNTTLLSLPPPPLYPTPLYHVTKTFCQIGGGL